MKNSGSDIQVVEVFAKCIIGLNEDINKYDGELL